MRFSSLLSAVFLCTLNLVSAHPEPVGPLSAQDLARRKYEIESRDLAVRQCGPKFADYHYERKRKRATEIGIVDHPFPPPKFKEPHYHTIQNFTCFTTPYVGEGPYYIMNELVRQNLTEGQAGVPLIFDIGVLDSSTCKPVPNAYVEIWNANSTGWYAGFSNSPTVTGPLASPPELTDSYNFLRGGLVTNEHGLVELDTVWPGYYTGRAPHIHINVFQNMKYSTNGTIYSEAGSLRQQSQVYLPEDLSDIVYSQYPYSTTSMTRTLNMNDPFWTWATVDGYNPIIDIVPVGENLLDGVYGHITIAINSSVTWEIWTDNFYTGAPKGNSPPLS